MKIVHHIPTETYGFTEFHLEGESLSYDEARALALAKAPEEPVIDWGGVTEAQFSQLVDRYYKDHTMMAEEYEALNEKQKYTIQTFKKLFKRNGKD